MVGLCFLIAIYSPMLRPSNSSMRSPGRARRSPSSSSRVRPAVQPRRLGLDLTSSCARRRRARRRSPRPPGGSGSCARRGGRGTCTCSRRSARSSSREMTGPDQDLRAFMRPPPPASARCDAGESLERRRSTSSDGADHVGDAGVAAEHDHAAGCCGRTWRTSPRRRRAAPARGPSPKSAERLGGRLGRGRVVDGGVADGERAAVGVHAERRAQRAAARLAVDLDRVAARRGAEGDAAAVAVAGADRAGAGAAGALLAPRPSRRSSRPRRGSASTRCRGGARAARRARPRRRAPVERLAEDRLGEVDLARSCRCSGAWSLAISASRPTSTTRALGPGHGAAQRSAGSGRRHVDDLEAALGHALVAHLARAAVPLNTREGVARRRSSPARARCASRG